MPTAATRTLLIAYDIAVPSPARPALVEAIMTLGEAWARPLETVWYLRTTRPADEVEACLAPLVGDGDGLMVQETRGDACLVNTGVRWFRTRRRDDEQEAAPAVASNSTAGIIPLRRPSAAHVERAAEAA